MSPHPSCIFICRTGFFCEKRETDRGPDARATDNPGAGESKSRRITRHQAAQAQANVPHKDRLKVRYQL